MTKRDFVDWAVGLGWSPDAFGHLHQGDYRFKLQATSVRLEKSHHTPDTQYSKGEKKWLRLRTGYFSKLSVNSEGKLKGLER